MRLLILALVLAAPPAWAACTGDTHASVPVCEEGTVLDLETNLCVPVVSG